MKSMFESLYKRRRIEREFLLGINKIKREFEQSIKSKGAMKITEETKIKEFIPEGYELNDSGGTHVEVIYILMKKKEVKDFNWYRLNYERNINKKYNIYLDSDPCTWIFEYRIGLLKFICNDIAKTVTDVLFFLYKLRIGQQCMGEFQSKIYSICPKEFINSIFQ